MKNEMFSERDQFNMFGGNFFLAMRSLEKYLQFQIVFVACAIQHHPVAKLRVQ